MGTLPGEIRRRRAFAIISHPNACKTILTENLLLFGGAIQLEDVVKAHGSGCARIGWRSTGSAASRSTRR